MNKGYFITGTDTGVGKTVVTAALALALRKQGLKVGVMKPVETGCLNEGGCLLPQDALLLRNVSGCMAPLQLIAPYTFATPLAPAIAAELGGVTIDIGHIRRCYQKLQAEHDVVLVEGAGGLLVPLSGQLTMQDVAVVLDVPVLIVARNVLGVINHTTLTVMAASKRSTVLGVVLNQTEPPDAGDLARRMNEQALRRWCRAPVYCQLPYIETLTAEALGSLGELLVTDRLLDSMGLRSFPFGVAAATEAVQQRYTIVEEKDEIPGARR